ncbi:hypothetical protein NOCA2480076 [metagenome]|uniref:Uncharacterized protein n=1 Tax=metagenome TaxID=256318 RepID=A0A2P2C7T3_9ZZZZ
MGRRGELRHKPACINLSEASLDEFCANRHPGQATAQEVFGRGCNSCEGECMKGGSGF